MSKWSKMSQLIFQRWQEISIGFFPEKPRYFHTDLFSKDYMMKQSWKYLFQKHEKWQTCDFEKLEALKRSLQFGLSGGERSEMVVAVATTLWLGWYGND